MEKSDNILLADNHATINNMTVTSEPPDLAQEVKGFQSFTAELAKERLKIEQQLARNQNSLQLNKELQLEISQLKDEISQLQEQIPALEKDLALHRRAYERMRPQVLAVEMENESFKQSYGEINKENVRLANLYMIGYRLHESLDLSEVFTIIYETIHSQVGCQQMIISELSADNLSLSLMWFSGIDPTPYHTISLGTGLITQAVKAGRTYLAEQAGAAVRLPEEANVTACIPLKLMQSVIGALILFQQPSEKPAFTSVDEELFELLSIHAAIAIHCAQLYTRANRRAVIE
ncbi:MAG: GAF domain-containing protein [Acidobacteriota bacterium]